MCKTKRFCFHHPATAVLHGDKATVLNPAVQVVLNNPFQSHVTLRAPALGIGNITKLHSRRCNLSLCI